MIWFLVVMSAKAIIVYSCVFIPNSEPSSSTVQLEAQCLLLAMDSTFSSESPDSLDMTAAMHPRTYGLLITAAPLVGPALAIAFRFVRSEPSPESVK